MTRPIVREYNSETNETIDREMNDAEFATYQQTQSDAAKEIVLITRQEARIEALKASIAIKRTATTWQPFTQDEADYLNSGS